MSDLFSPWTLGEVTFRNRIFVAPMCQYSSADGHPTDWHFVHLGSRAVGGAGLVMIEASAVTPAGRITPADLGLWQDAHIAEFKRNADFIHAQGAAVGVQLAHAGRKASCDAPWRGGKALSAEQGGWQTVAPSAIAFSDGSSTPHALTHAEIVELVDAFAAAAERALAESMAARQNAIAEAVQTRRYEPALEQVAMLAEPLDAFFDQVMVMVDDPALRDNRLALLQALDGLCRQVVDVSRLALD